MARSRFPLNIAPVALVILLAGCSANKTGSHWSLASINPFKKSQPDAPYPQKPSSFASPSSLPDENRRQMLTGTQSQPGSLGATTSPQVYPATQTSPGNSPLSGQIGGSQVIPSGQPGAQRQVSAGPAWYDPAGFPQSQGQSVRTEAAGNAYVADSGGARVGRQTPQATGVTGQSPVPNIPSTQMSGVAAATTTPPSTNVNVGVPVSYDSPPVAGHTYDNSAPGAPPGGAWTQTRSAIPSPPSSGPLSASPGNGAMSQPDWRQLVGDRYAQLYQQSSGTRGADFPVSTQPGNPSPTLPVGSTGYVPGQTPNPPGNVPYEPGNTGYRPPGIPPYTPPNTPTMGNQQTPWPGGSAGENANPVTTSDVTSGSSRGEYRPGSTKSYVPRSGGTPTSSWGPTSSASGGAGCGSLACPTPSRADPAGATESFRL